jgi:hypothetical protein
MREHDQNHDQVLQRWLEDGRSWMARLQKTGLSAAGRELLDEGCRWQLRGGLLGWQHIDHLLGTLLQEDASPAARARAMLDLSAWLATALRVLQATELISNAGAQKRPRP